MHKRPKFVEENKDWIEAQAKELSKQFMTIPAGQFAFVMHEALRNWIGSSNARPEGSKTDNSAYEFALVFVVTILRGMSVDERQQFIDVLQGNTDVSLLSDLLED